MGKNDYYSKSRRDAYKFVKYKKYFKSKPISTKNFEKKINHYYDVYKTFWAWRINFKYPELNYLSRLKTLKPAPSDDLIIDLAKSISELKNIYLDLKDYRALIIFKLFFYYIAQCLKAKLKIKFHKGNYFGSGSVDLDIDSIIGDISTHFLDIKSTDKDPKAKKYSCECGRYKKKPKDENFKCDNPKCHGYVQKLDREPWHSDPWSFTFNDIGPLNRFTESREYKKYEKEIKNLLKTKNKMKILNIKYAYGKFYKITANEKIVDNFFRLNLHNDNEEIEKIVFNKTIEINKDIKKRIILAKDEKNIEFYWGDAENSKPHGKGISEKYETDDTRKKVFKKVGMMWWKKYSKNLNVKDLKGYIINEKYDGEWKNGKRDGKGELIIFQDPAFVSNKDWTPSIMEKYIGTFQNGEMHGEIKQYDDISKEWTLTSYKNGVAGKSVKINKK